VKGATLIPHIVLATPTPSQVPNSRLGKPPNYIVIRRHFGSSSSLCRPYCTPIVKAMQAMKATKAMKAKKAMKPKKAMKAKKGMFAVWTQKLACRHEAPFLSWRFGNTNKGG
jgi:hypothetical protein